MRLSRDALRAKIEANVKIVDGCWVWQKSLGSHGYGNIATGGGRNETAHRVSCEVYHGESSGSYVLHSCDNRACCNPAHLSWDTQSNNIIDMVVKKRRPAMKLDVDKVRYIRSCGRPSKVLAEELGVSRDLINKVLSRKAWSHVD